MGIRFRRGHVVRGMGIDLLRKIKWRMFSIVSHGRAEQAAPYEEKVKSYGNGVGDFRFEIST